MGISKKIEVIVKDNYEIKLSTLLQFYKNDALNLRFTISEYNLIFENNKLLRQKTPIVAEIAKLLIETPDGVDFTEPTKITGNEICFFVDSKFTKNIGFTRMQIILKDRDGCRVTLPEFKMEIREPIGDEKQGSTVAICGEFLCGAAICGDTSTVSKSSKTIEITRSLSDLFYEKFGGDF